MAACSLPVDSWQDCQTNQVPIDCHPVTAECDWRDGHNFQVPERSLWVGGDKCGSNMRYEDDWCSDKNGFEVISGATQCGIIDGGYTVPNSEQVLISKAMIDNTGSNNCHCHARRNRCCSRRTNYPITGNCYSSSDDCGEATYSPTEKKIYSRNENKINAQCAKSTCKSTTSSAKSGAEGHHHSEDRNGHCHCVGHSCRYMQNTKMVPKVSVQPRVRYVPRVVNERNVRYVPQSEVLESCAEAFETSGGHRRCKEAIVCQRPRSEERCNSSSSSEKEEPSRKSRCW